MFDTKLWGFPKDRWGTRDSRELETSEKPKRGWWERAWTASREWWEGKWERGLFLRFPSLRSSKLSLSYPPKKWSRATGEEAVHLKEVCLIWSKMNDWRTADTNLLSRHFDWPFYPINDFGSNWEYLSGPSNQWAKPKALKWNFWLFSDIWFSLIMRYARSGASIFMWKCALKCI